MDLRRLRRACQNGQASVELLAAVPFVLWWERWRGSSRWLGTRPGCPPTPPGRGARGRRRARSSRPRLERPAEGLRPGLRVERLPRGGVRVHVRIPALLHRWRTPARVRATASLGRTRGDLSGGRTPILTSPRAGESGQATVELLGAVPVVILMGLIAFQLLAVGYAAVQAGAAAEAGALALAAGGDARAGARESLPGWSRARARITVSGRRVEVRLRPASPLAAISRRFVVSADASVAGP